MALKFIKLGEINRKHLLPFLLVLSNLINQIINKFYPEHEHRNNPILDLYSTSLGFIFVLFIPLIFKIAERDIPKENEIQKRKCLHYFALIGTFILYMGGKALPNIIKGKYDSGDIKVTNPFSEGPFTYVGVEMILLTVASIIFFKYKYYIHHIITIIGFILFGNISDIFLDSYTEMQQLGALYNVIILVSLILDVIYLNTEKYLLEKLYYPYWKINLSLGITLFFFASLGLIILLINKDKENSESPLISGFYKYFIYNHPGIIAGKFILYTISNFIFVTLSIINIYYFNPNYFLINFQFSKFVMALINNKEPKRFFCIIFFILQFFCLMIYLEIIELNFLGLNKNTKRNIELRGIEEVSGNDRKDSILGGNDTIDINEDYYINSLEKNKEPLVEMTPKSYEDEMNPQ